eukprot:2621335-Pyramimonas_sp.AAC.1
MYCTILHRTALFCTALYCTVLYCTVLYCIIKPVVRLRSQLSDHTRADHTPLCSSERCRALYGALSVCHRLALNTTLIVLDVPPVLLPQLLLLRSRAGGHFCTLRDSLYFSSYGLHFRSYRCVLSVVGVGTCRQLSTTILYTPDVHGRGFPGAGTGALHGGGQEHCGGEDGRTSGRGQPP